jgi:hypothetical protein
MDSTDDPETRIQEAITALRSGSSKSIRQAADTFDVPRSTLQDRLRGLRPNKISKQGMQRLTPEEEDSIDRAVHQLFLWGWPISISGLETLARQLLDHKGDQEPLGKNWYLAFLARHPDLKTLWSRTLDQSRKDATNYETASKWFNLYQTIKALYDIDDDDTYNMDEKGCMRGIGENVKVLVPRSEAEAFSIQPGNREWVSIIECISATGYILPPLFIFQGQRIQEDWVNTTIDKNAVVRVTPRGWTDNTVAIDWIQHFEKHTTRQTRGLYRLLILDGHTSHISIEFVQYCQNHKIVLLCLPPHSTHYLQPLDVGIFGPLAQAYRTLVSQGSIYGARRIDQLQFLQYYQLARKTITRNVASAWRGAGLVPFKPDSILQRLRPKSPPIASLTDSSGYTVNLPIEGPLADQIDHILAQLREVCPTSPIRKKIDFVKHTALTAIADRTTLRAMNQSLVEKTTTWRKKNTAKHFGEARVLVVEDLLNKAQEREVKDAEEAQAKTRRAALRGKVGFAKLVWKEFSMSSDLFE